MVNSALARQVIDKVVGYTVSPILNKCMIGYDNVSAGRCQTPALKLLVDRQKEIVEVFKVKKTTKGNV